MTVKLKREYTCDMCDKAFNTPKGYELRCKKLGQTIAASKHVCEDCWANHGVVNLRGFYK